MIGGPANPWFGFLAGRGFGVLLKGSNDQRGSEPVAWVSRRACARCASRGRQRSAGQRPLRLGSSPSLRSCASQERQRSAGQRPRGSGSSPSLRSLRCLKDGNDQRGSDRFAWVSRRARVRCASQGRQRSAGQRPRRSGFSPGARSLRSSRAANDRRGSDPVARISRRARLRCASQSSQRSAGQRPRGLGSWPSLRLLRFSRTATISGAATLRLGSSPGAPSLCFSEAANDQRRNSSGGCRRLPGAARSRGSGFRTQVRT